MKENFRLIQVIESTDNKTGEEMTIFELTPIDYNLNRTGYNFNTEPSPKNYFFACENNSEYENFFMNDPEEIKNIDFAKFVLNLIKTPEGIRKTYFTKYLENERKRSELWYSKATEEIENGKQVAFKFSHIEYSIFTYGDDYDNNKMDLIPSSTSDIEFQEQENYLVIDKNTVIFSFKNDNGIFTRIKGKITLIESDKFGRFTKIQTLSNWALSDNVPISYEFNTEPLRPLSKSYRNVVISIFGNNFEPYIKMQWSLLFAEYMGIVQFK